jgi:hypothetical protein
MMKFEWEEIDPSTWRTKTFDGWIVRSDYSGEGEAMVFVPDEEHQWEIDE